MIHVDLDKILTAKALQEHLGTILYDVEEKEELFVITKKGRPRAALINIDYLQELTGKELDEGREYDQYPVETADETERPERPEPTKIGERSDMPQLIQPKPQQEPETDTEPEPVAYPDLDIDSLEIPEEEAPQYAEPEPIESEPEPAPAEPAEIVMPVPSVNEAPAIETILTPIPAPTQPAAPTQPQPVQPPQTVLPIQPIQNSAPLPDQAPPPATPPPSQ